MLHALVLDRLWGADDASRRWDGTSVHAWSGTYGDYLTAKVRRVFPELWDEAGGQAPRAILEPSAVASTKSTPSAQK